MAETRTPMLDFRQDATLSQSLHEYVADPVFTNTQTAVGTEGTGDTREDSQPKPEDSDFKQDLSLSQSFQQYEVMDAVLRNSQSSLLAVLEKAEAEESVEEEEKKKEEEVGEEEKAEEGKENEGKETKSDEVGGADSQDRYRRLAGMLRSLLNCGAVNIRVHC